MEMISSVTKIKAQKKNTSSSFLESRPLFFSYSIIKLKLIIAKPKLILVIYSQEKLKIIRGPNFRWNPPRPPVFISKNQAWSMGICCIRKSHHVIWKIVKHGKPSNPGEIHSDERVEVHFANNSKKVMKKHGCYWWDWNCYEKKWKKSVIRISSGRIHVLRMTCFLVPAILFYYYWYRDYFYWKIRENLLVLANIGLVHVRGIFYKR